VDTEETGSATKKRKTDNASFPDQNKDGSSNQVNEPSRERERDKNRDKERERDNEKEREKEKEKEREKDREKEKEKDKVKDRIKDKEKDRDSHKDKDSHKVRDSHKEKDKTGDNDKEKEKDKDKDKDKDLREPETINRPPLEAVRPVSSTLRNLKNPSSSIPKPQSSTPNSPITFITAAKPFARAQPSSTTKSQTTPLQASNFNDPKVRPSGQSLSGNELPKSKPIPSAVHLQPRVGPSKQLKTSSETINPTTRNHLTDRDLKLRLEAFKRLKDGCVKEINSKFDSIFEMFVNKELENKSILKNEIDGLDRPLQDFNKVLLDLKSLHASQRI
jgi:hypothetical protein